MRVRIYAVIIAIVSALVIGIQTRIDPQWAFDGYAYAIRAQLDAGIPYDVAQARAQAANFDKPTFRAPAARKWFFEPRPQWWDLFQVRVLYPWLASLLWPFFGFTSLFIVSNLSFVAAAILLYTLLLRFARPEFAALIALGIMLLPESRLIGRSDLTDMTAYALWIATLLAMMRYAENSRRADLGVYALVATVMSFTRPIAYMPLCCAIALAASRRFRQAFALGTIAAGLCVVTLAVMLFTRTHATPMPGYAASLMRSAADSLQWSIDSLVTPFTVYALWLARRRADVVIALGALLSVIPTLILNPLPTDVLRVVVLPSLPAIGCGMALMLETLARSRGQLVPVEHPGSGNLPETLRRTMPRSSGASG